MTEEARFKANELVREKDSCQSELRKLDVIEKQKSAWISYNNTSVALNKCEQEAIQAMVRYRLNKRITELDAALDAL